MIAAAEGFIQELSQRYPAIRARNSIYSFSDFEKSFANSRGVRQSERRGKYGFGAGFCGKDGRRTTSFNHSGAASFEPFERLLAVGTVERLLDETLRSFEAQAGPWKICWRCHCHAGLPALAHGKHRGRFVGIGFVCGHHALQGAEGRTDRQREIQPSQSSAFARIPRRCRFRRIRRTDAGSRRRKRWCAERISHRFLHGPGTDVPQTAGAWNFVVPAGDTPIDEIIEHRAVASSFRVFQAAGRTELHSSPGSPRIPFMSRMVKSNMRFVN